MTPFAQALSAALLHFVWQGLLVAFILWIALATLRHRSANARYFASSAAMAMLAILPAITTGILYRVAAPVRGSVGFAASILQAAAVIPRAAGGFAWMAMLQAWALPLWSAGVAIFALRLLWGCRQVSSLRRSGQSAESSVIALANSLCVRLGLTREVSVVITSQSDSPSVVGWLRPAILLPAATLLGLTEQQLEAVLAHELAHIRRHDYLVNLLQNLVETVLFYHPAVWWTSARMRHERELCCDDVAVHSCGDAICYARALTTLEKMRDVSPSLALGSTGGSLLYRIQRLMGVRTREAATSRVPAIAAVVLGIACLALNMNWAQAQEQGVPGILGFVQTADGPGVQVDMGGATVAERRGVEYPGSAWEHKIGGIVVVEATLSGDGAVSDARVLNGPAELRKTVLQSILEWRFAAAPAGTTRQISINFNWEQAQKMQEQSQTKSVTFDGKTFLVRDNPEATTILLREEVRAVENRADDPITAEYVNRVGQNLVRNSDAKVPFTIKVQDVEGRKVTHIQYSGISELQQKQLAERLPVHLGDTLTHVQVEALTDVLRQVDPRLGHTFSFDENNRTEIQIFPVR